MGENSKQHVDYRRLLEQKIERVAENYRSCTVCELRCEVDRLSGQLGRCLLPAEAFSYKEYLHYGEEASVVPSHTIFVSGCNLRCVECSDWKWITTPRLEQPIDEQQMVRRIEQRQREGAQNLHFVGGEADVNIYGILKLLLAVGRPLPIVWNTNLYGTPFLYEILDGLVQTWIVDLKHGPSECADRITGVSGYFATVTRNLRQIRRSGTVIVRQLVLPDHLECCSKPALRWLETEVPELCVNLMTGFYPFRRRRGLVPSRRLTNGEKRDIIHFFQELKFTSAMIDGLWDKRSRS